MITNRALVLRKSSDEECHFSAGYRRLLGPQEPDSFVGCSQWPGDKDGLQRWALEQAELRQVESNIPGGRV